MSQKEVEQHLEMGKKMLAAGQLADALSHYHAAAGQESYYVLGQNLFCCLSHFNCWRWLPLQIYTDKVDSTRQLYHSDFIYLSKNHCNVLWMSEGDPTNYMTFYRRATVYLAMGKSKQALPDLDTVITLKPDFTAVRLRRYHTICGISVVKQLRYYSLKRLVSICGTLVVLLVCRFNRIKTWVS